MLTAWPACECSCVSRREIETTARRVMVSLPADHEDILMMMQHILTIKDGPRESAEGQNPSGSASTRQ